MSQRGNVLIEQTQPRVNMWCQ